MVIPNFSANSSASFLSSLVSKGLVLEKYSFDLGEAISINQNKVKRMFFTISYDEFEKQMDDATGEG